MKFNIYVTSRTTICSLILNVFVFFMCRQPEHLPDQPGWWQWQPLWLPLTCQQPAIKTHKGNILSLIRLGLTVHLNQLVSKTPSAEVTPFCFCLNQCCLIPEKQSSPSSAMLLLFYCSIWDLHLCPVWMLTHPLLPMTPPLPHWLQPLPQNHTADRPPAATTPPITSRGLGPTCESSGYGWTCRMETYTEAYW